MGAERGAGGRALVSAARLGATSAVAGAVAATVLTLACWLPDASVTGHPGAAVRAGVLAFLAGNHPGVTLAGVPVGFLPLLLLALVAVVLWRGAAGLPALVEAAPGRRAAAEVAGAFAGGYAVVCAVLVPVGRVGDSGAGLVATVCAALVLAALVAAGALVRHGAVDLPRMPGFLRAGLRPAAAGLVGYLALGALTVAGSLVCHAGTVETLSRTVGGGLAGIPLVVLGILSAPNAAVAAAAYAAGPGFAVGTAIGPFGRGHGVLPAFPLLGAVPGGRAPGIVLALLAVGVVGCGVLPGVLAARRCSPLVALRTVGVAAVLAGLGMAVLAWQAGGGLGTGRLRAVGASPWRVGSAVAVELAVIGAVTVGACWLVRRLGLAMRLRQVLIADREVDRAPDPLTPVG